MSKKTPKAYAKAGVDIDLANNLLKNVKRHFKSATRPEMLTGIGGFGGLFDISKLTQQMKHPVLVSSTDGVGTKLKVACMADKHDGVGLDIVNHCLNDIAVMGATPLYFLDYFACSSLDEKVYTPVMAGVAKACRNADCALLGGETCELPGLYHNGDYDLVGTVTGIVDKPRILTGDMIRPGDVAIGFASNGLHTNGYSLARKIFFDQLGLGVDDLIPGQRIKVGNALLKPHTNYSGVLNWLLAKYNTATRSNVRKGNAIHGAAHITGGGFNGNIPRILPERTGVEIDVTSWPLPPVFQGIRDTGLVDTEELYEVFNMGIGLVLFASQDQTFPLLEDARNHGVKAYLIGEVSSSNTPVTLLHG